MADQEARVISKLLNDHEQEILSEWLDLLSKSGALQTGRIKQAELSVECQNFLPLLREGLDRNGADSAGPAYAPAREFLTALSRSRAQQGFSPVETATFVFSLKQPLFAAANRGGGAAPKIMASIVWAITELLDKLGLLTFEAFQTARENVIQRQQREITELSELAPLV